MAYTTIDAPTNFFDTLTYTGNGNTNQEVNGLNFTPSYIWIKGRDTAHPHTNIDSVRGGNKYLKSNETAAEQTDPTYGWIDSFDSDGFTTQIGSNSTPWNVNKNGETYVAWCWKTGTSFSNDASSTGIGDIDSSGSVNTTAGFSIVSYTGNGTSGTEVAHGLGSTPDMYITKNRSYSSGYSWGVYHKDIADNKGLFLDLTSASTTGTGFRDSTAPTSSVFTLGGGSQPYRYTSNKSSDTYIGYFFKSVKGYSKFGSYTGNGAVSGPFIYLGFKPAFFLLKESSGSDNWTLMDTKRLGYNPRNDHLFPNLNNVEYATDRIDIVSNGIKINNDDGSINQSGSTYIYMAFAESPLTNSKGVPCNAR